MQVTFGANVNLKFKINGTSEQASKATKSMQESIENCGFKYDFDDFKYDSTKQEGSFVLDDSLLNSAKGIFKNIVKKSGAKLSLRSVKEKKK